MRTVLRVLVVQSELKLFITTVPLLLKSIQIHVTSTTKKYPRSVLNTEPKRAAGSPSNIVNIDNFGGGTDEAALKSLPLLIAHLKKMASARTVSWRRR
jgi:hypothetical protein